MTVQIPHMIDLIVTENRTMEKILVDYFTDLVEAIDTLQEELDTSEATVAALDVRLTALEALVASYHP